MKIIVNPLTYFILFLFLICGYFNYFLIISFILLMHDIGHLIMMKLFKVEIMSIEILPFGSIINTSIKYNLNSNKLFLIASSGIFMQLILYIMFNWLFEINIINNISYNIFLIYNKYIILFNLLPIIPLDGSKMLTSLLERFIPYKYTIIIGYILSLIFIILFIFSGTISLNIILISLFLFMKTYEEVILHNYIFMKFLIERYLMNINNKKIKRINSFKKVYKNKYNIINGKRESVYLAKLFDKQGYFWYYLFVCNEFINRTEEVKSWLSHLKGES